MALSSARNNERAQVSNLTDQLIDRVSRAFDLLPVPFPSPSFMGTHERFDGLIRYGFAISTAQFSGAQDGVLVSWIDASNYYTSSWCDFSSDDLLVSMPYICYFTFDTTRYQVCVTRIGPQYRGRKERVE